MSKNGLVFSKLSDARIKESAEAIITRCYPDFPQVIPIIPSLIPLLIVTYLSPVLFAIKIQMQIKMGTCANLSGAVKMSKSLVAP